VLAAFGGNGPVHAAEVARQLDIADVVVPPWPGLFSAFGLLAAETRHELSQAHRVPFTGLTTADLAAGLDGLEQTACAALRDEGHADASIVAEHYLDLRYRGQSSELRVPVPPLDGPAALDTIVAAFQQEHLQTYGHQDTADRIELVAFRVVASVAEQIPPPRVEPGRGPAGLVRTAYFGQERGSLPTPVIGRGDLDGTPRSGPLIVEEYDATTIVPPDWSARLDAYGNIRLTALGAEDAR
jgi:N-methylhydantoinase A